MSEEEPKFEVDCKECMVEMKYIRSLDRDDTIYYEFCCDVCSMAIYVVFYK